MARNPAETDPKTPSGDRMGSRPPRPIAMRNSGTCAPRLRTLYECSESMRLVPFPGGVRLGGRGLAGV